MRWQQPGTSAWVRWKEDEFLDPRRACGSLSRQVDSATLSQWGRQSLAAPQPQQRGTLGPVLGGIAHTV